MPVHSWSAPWTAFNLRHNVERVNLDFGLPPAATSFFSSHFLFSACSSLLVSPLPSSSCLLSSAERGCACVWSRGQLGSREAEAGRAKDRAWHLLSRHEKEAADTLGWDRASWDDGGRRACKLIRHAGTAHKHSGIEHWANHCEQPTADLSITRAQLPKLPQAALTAATHRLVPHCCPHCCSSLLFLIVVPRCCFSCRSSLLFLIVVPHCCPSLFGTAGLETKVAEQSWVELGAAGARAAAVLGYTQLLWDSSDGDGGDDEF